MGTELQMEVQSMIESATHEPSVTPTEAAISSETLTPTTEVTPTGTTTPTAETLSPKSHGHEPLERGGVPDRRRVPLRRRRNHGEIHYQWGICLLCRKALQYDCEWDYISIQKTYAFGAISVAVRTDGVLKWVLSDHLGSTSITANEDGA